MYRKNYRASVAFLILLFSVQLLAANKTIQFQDGLAVNGSSFGGTDATWLDKNSPDTCYSGGGICRAGFQSGGTAVFRTLIRYNLSFDAGFKANDIVSARLIMKSDGGFEGSGTCELRVLGSSDEDWLETQATWNEKRKDLDISWVGGGGFGTNYGAVIDTVAFTSGAPTNTNMTFDLTGGALDVVKDWLSGLNSEGTLILKTQSESGTGNNYIDFYSENYATASYRPILEITYNEPVIQIQNGLEVGGVTYEGGETTWLNSGSPDTCYGLGSTCRVGFESGGSSVFRTIIRFGQLSHWADIDMGFSADDILTAKLILITDTAFAGSGTCELRVVNDNDLGWTQGYTTWNYKRTDTNPDIAWAGGGGLGTN